MMINSSMSNVNWQLSHRTVVEIPISLSLRWTVPQKELRHMFKKVKSVLESRTIRPCNNPSPCWSHLHVHAEATFTDRTPFLNGFITGLQNTFEFPNVQLIDALLVTFTGEPVFVREFTYNLPVKTSAVI